MITSALLLLEYHKRRNEGKVPWWRVTPHRRFIAMQDCPLRRHRRYGLMVSEKLMTEGLAHLPNGLTNGKTRYAILRHRTRLDWMAGWLAGQTPPLEIITCLMTSFGPGEYSMFILYRQNTTETCLTKDPAPISGDHHFRWTQNLVSVSMLEVVRYFGQQRWG